MAPMATRAPALLALLLACLGLAEASHFRYGTLSWAPTGKAVADPNTAQVEFTFKAAFRRNYNWGSYFGEQWLALAPGESPVSRTYYGSELMFKQDLNVASFFAAGFVDPGTAALRDCASKNDLTLKECFDCPFCIDANTRATNPTKVDCFDTVATPVRLDCQTATPEEIEVAGGCTDYHGCRLSNPQIFPRDPSVASLYIRFPPIKQDNGANVVPCENPFQCDYKYANETGPTPQFTNLPNTVSYETCKLFKNNPSMMKERCGAWDEIYGMFLGDEDNNVSPVEMLVSEMDYTTNPITGNYLQGQGKFEHTYRLNTMYTAFFTGGFRLYECNYNPFLTPSDPGYYTGLDSAVDAVVPG